MVRRLLGAVSGPEEEVSEVLEQESRGGLAPRAASIGA